MNRHQKSRAKKFVSMTLVIAVACAGCRQRIATIAKPIAAAATKASSPVGNDVSADLQEIHSLAARLEDKTAAAEKATVSPKLEEEVKQVESFATFCDLFYERTKQDFAVWQKQAKETLAKLDGIQKSPTLEAPKADDLVALLAELSQHPERHTKEQEAAIISAKDLLGKYLACLDSNDPAQPGVKQLIEGLQTAALTFKGSIDSINAVAEPLKGENLPANEAQAKVQALFSEVRKTLDEYHAAGAAVPKVAEAAESKVAEAKVLRASLADALKLLQQWIDDPRLDVAVKKFEDEEKQFWEKATIVAAILSPVLGIVMLLASLLFGGGSPGGDGGGEGGESGKESKGTAENSAEDAGGQGSVGSNDPATIPPNATPRAIKGPKDGDYCFVAYDLNGTTFLRVYPKNKPENAIELPFNLRAYDAKFGELATVFEAGNLAAKSVSMLHPFPVVVIFEGTKIDTALRWNDSQSIPELLGGPPPSIAPDEANVPIKAPSDGTLYLYLISKQGQMSIRIHASDASTKRPAQLLADLQLNTNELCEPGKESLLTIEDGIGIQLEGSNPYPVTIDFTTPGGERKRLIWADAGSHPTVLIGPSNQSQ